MKIYSIPMFLPTSSGITGLRYQSQLRRRQDLNLGQQHLQSGAQSTELSHLPSLIFDSTLYFPSTTIFAAARFIEFIAYYLIASYLFPSLNFNHVTPSHL